MLIWLHVSAALSSLLISSSLLLYPGRLRFNLSYGLIALTLASGTYLTISLHVKLLQACLGGLVYLGLVSILLAGARYRLASARIKNGGR